MPSTLMTGLPRIDPQPLLEHDPAVDLHPALVDELLAGPSATDSGRGEDLLKADLRPARRQSSSCLNLNLRFAR